MILNSILVYFAPLLLSTLRINMEPVNFGYSTKNIPIAQPKEYLKCLVEKTESFLRRIRWKAHHFLKPAQSHTNETFGFRTTKSPPAIKELDQFEDKMVTLIQNIEFKTDRNEFQRKLSQDLTKIRNNNNLLIAADKTTNFYQLDAPRVQEIT